MSGESSGEDVPRASRKDDVADRVTVREAGKGDEAAVAELVGELAHLEGETAAATPELVAEYLDFPLSGALLAELDGEVAGLLTWFVRPGLYHGGRWGYIDEVVVREHARRRGVADALLEAAMTRFVAAGCVEVSVSTMPDNEPAKALYRKHGLVDEALFLERHFSPGSLRLRPAGRSDAAFLAEMLAEAAAWDRSPSEPPPPSGDVLVTPRVADYVEAWGRDGDGGAIAEWDGEPVGACWFRRFTAARPGYGYLGEDVPGLGLAVREGYRRRGIGGALLRAALADLRESGAAAVSLSVAAQNDRARRLYDRAGFETVGREGGSLTLRLRLRDGS